MQVVRWRHHPMPCGNIMMYLFSCELFPCSFERFIESVLVFGEEVSVILLILLLYFIQCFPSLWVFLFNKFLSLSQPFVLAQCQLLFQALLLIAQFNQFLKVEKVKKWYLSKWFGSLICTWRKIRIGTWFWIQTSPQQSINLFIMNCFCLFMEVAHQKHASFTKYHYQSDIIAEWLFVWGISFRGYFDIIICSGLRPSAWVDPGLEPWIWSH